MVSPTSLLVPPLPRLSQRDLPKTQPLRTILQGTLRAVIGMPPNSRRLLGQCSRYRQSHNLRFPYYGCKCSRVLRKILLSHPCKPVEETVAASAVHYNPPVRMDRID